MRARARRPLLKSLRFWLPLGILVILIVGVGAGIAGKRILDQAYEARDALAQAIPLAKTAQKQILDSDSDGAEETVARLSALTAKARASTSGSLWRSAEALPFVGPNLTAVRTVSAVADDLATEAVTPLSTLSLDRLTPSGGRIDTGAISEASTIIDRAGQRDHARGGHGGRHSRGAEGGRSRDRQRRTGPRRRRRGRTGPHPGL